MARSRYGADAGNGSTTGRGRCFGSTLRDKKGSSDSQPRVHTHKQRSLDPGPDPNPHLEKMLDPDPQPRYQEHVCKNNTFPTRILSRIFFNFKQVQPSTIYMPFNDTSNPFVHEKRETKHN